MQTVPRPLQASTAPAGPPSDAARQGGVLDMPALHFMALLIALLVLAIAANIAGMWLQQEVLQSLVSSTLQRAPLPPHAADVFGGFVTAARAGAVLLTLAACGLLAWIIRRLMSPAVRQEFA